MQSCDMAKAALAKAGVPYQQRGGAGGSVAQVRIGDGGAMRLVSRAACMTPADFKTASAAF